MPFGRGGFISYRSQVKCGYIVFEQRRKYLAGKYAKCEKRENKTSKLFYSLFFCAAN
jgi:hypothetical protein